MASYFTVVLTDGSTTDETFTVTVADGSATNETFTIGVTDGSATNETYTVVVTDGSATDEIFTIQLQLSLTHPGSDDDYFTIDGIGGGTGGEGDGEAEPDAPNILLIYLDDVGHDYMGHIDQIEFSLNKFNGVPLEETYWPLLPAMQTIANEGVVFNNAYNSATCSPGRAMWQTGRSQLRHGMGTVQREDNCSTEGRFGLFENGHMEWGVDRITDDVTEITIASILGDEGYKTCCVGKWHLSLPNGSTDALGAYTAARWWQDDPKTGLDYGRIPWNRAPSGLGNVPYNAGYVSHGWKHPQKMGWQHFRGVINNLDRHPTTDLANTFSGSGLTDAATGGEEPGYYNYVWYDSVDNQVRQSVTYVTKYSRQEVDDFIKNQTGDDPWLVCWNLSAAHSPWGNRIDNGAGNSGCRAPAGEIHSDPDPYADNYPADDGAVWDSVRSAMESIDWNIGELRSSLGSTIWDNTMVVIMGDNGSASQALQDAVAIGDAFGASYTNDVIQTGHLKGSLYEGGIKVPLIVSGPLVGGTAGRKSMEPVFVTDLFATILDWAGAGDLPDQEGRYYDSYSFAGVLSQDKTEAKRSEIFVEKWGINGYPGFSAFDSNSVRQAALIMDFLDPEFGDLAGTWKFMIKPFEPTASGPYELYKLRMADGSNADSNETDDFYYPFFEMLEGLPGKKIVTDMYERAWWYFFSNGDPVLNQGYDT